MTLGIDAVCRSVLICGNRYIGCSWGADPPVDPARPLYFTMDLTGEEIVVHGNVFDRCAGGMKLPESRRVLVSRNLFLRTGQSPWAWVDDGFGVPLRFNEGVALWDSPTGAGTDIGHRPPGWIRVVENLLREPGAGVLRELVRVGCGVARSARPRRQRCVRLHQPHRDSGHGDAPVPVPADEDEQAEVLMVDALNISLHEDDGTLISHGTTFEPHPLYGFAAPPCVADLDGDGAPELGLVRLPMATPTCPASPCWATPKTAGPSRGRSGRWTRTRRATSTPTATLPERITERYAMRGVTFSVTAEAVGDSALVVVDDDGTGSGVQPECTETDDVAYIAAPCP